MSAKLVGAVLDLDGISATEKLLLVVLADSTNAATFRCDPGWARIARQTGLSESGARKVADRLVKKGLLEKSNRSGRTNTYRVLPRSTPDSTLLPQSDRGGATQGDRGSVTPGVTANQKEPEKNRDRREHRSVDRARRQLLDGHHHWRPGTDPSGACAECGKQLTEHDTTGVLQ